MNIGKLDVSYEELKSLVLDAFRRKPKTQYIEILYDVASLAVSKSIVANPHQGVVSGAQYNLHPTDRNKVLEIIWDLIIERILTMGGEGVGEGWPFLSTTEYGKMVLDSRDPIPHDPSGYLGRLNEIIPSTDPIILTYLQESLRTYNIRALLSSTIALGCASEKAVLLLIDSFTSAINDETKRQSFISKIDGAFIKKKYDEFIRKFHLVKAQLPKELVDGLDITLTGVFEMIRTSRNDAGHPTGVIPPREQVYASLQLFIPYLKKIYDLIAHFSTNKVSI